MNFKKLVKLQCYIMLNKINFKISFSIMMLYALGVYLLNVHANLHMDISSTLSASSLFVLDEMGEYFRYLQNLFPFLVLFPYSFSYLEDKKTRMGSLLQVRMSNKYYYLSQMVSCFLGGMLLFFVPLLLNLILTNITFIETGYTYYGYYNDYGYCSDLLGTNATIPTVNTGMSYLGVYLTSPFLYSLMYTLFISLFAGLFSIFGLSCSFYIKNNKITLLIINYLLFLGGTILNNISNSSNMYLNTKLLDYVSINTIMGKSTLFFLGVCSILFVFSIISMCRMTRVDQL